MHLQPYPSYHPKIYAREIPIHAPSLCYMKHMGQGPPSSIYTIEVSHGLGHAKKRRKMQGFLMLKIGKVVSSLETF